MFPGISSMSNEIGTKNFLILSFILASEDPITSYFTLFFKT